MMQRAREEAKDADALAAAGDSAGATRKVASADSMLAADLGYPDSDGVSTLRPSGDGWTTGNRGWPPLAEPAYHEEHIDDGLEHAERALRLKPDNPDALEVRGTLPNIRSGSAISPEPMTRRSCTRSSAEEDLRASVRINPEQASAWTTLSHLLINKPAVGEAKLAALRAYEADPYLSNANVSLWRLFTTSYDLEDPIEAKKWCDEGRARFPKDVPVPGVSALAVSDEGDQAGHSAGLGRH